MKKRKYPPKILTPLQKMFSFLSVQFGPEVKNNFLIEREKKRKMSRKKKIAKIWPPSPPPKQFIVVLFLFFQYLFQLTTPYKSLILFCVNFHENYSVFNTENSYYLINPL